MIRAQNFVILLLLTLLFACANDSKMEVVEISGGVAILGRTPEEVEEDYKECIEMVTRTGQSQSLCNPMEDVFGDVPARTQEVDTFWMAVFPTADEVGYPDRVSFEEAVRLCEEVGGQLPTAEQWEFAARGTEGRMWPWGNEPPTDALANIDAVGGKPNRPMLPNGYHAGGATPEGVKELVGNAWEWVTKNGKPALKGGASGTYSVFAKPYHIVRFMPEGAARCVFDHNPN